jgi:hypothetical protein
MKLVQSLTNVRPVKNDAPELIMTSTKGTGKLTPKGAGLVGVADEDSLVIAKLDFEDESGERYYVTKGSEMTKKELSSAGQKLAAINGKAGGYLQFSGRNAYNELVESAGVKIVDGKAEKNVHFSILGAEAEEAEQVKEYGGQNFYPLVFSHVTDVIVQKKSVKTPGGAENLGVEDNGAGEEEENL